MPIRIQGFTRRFVNKKHMRSVMELFMADLAFELKKNERRFLPQNLLFKIAPFWKFQK